MTEKTGKLSYSYGDPLLRSAKKNLSFDMLLPKDLQKPSISCGAKGMAFFRMYHYPNYPKTIAATVCLPPATAQCAACSPQDGVEQPHSQCGDLTQFQVRSGGCGRRYKVGLGFRV